jgi:hypothetical protein
MLLCALGLSRTNPAKPRAGIFLPDDPFWRKPCMQKFPMPLAGALGHQFCRIFAEAYLLTGKKNAYGRIKLQKQKRVKARQKSGPGSLACSAEAFFCLDFFWSFFVSRQKRTSLRGN